ncbi:ELOB [Lepeophtheirus salmonis]|uniref:ELOB n=1 Tax=Lepeophtheirus salmonis TaxID=72036 RepID=A0A7R8D0D9_LEPSM|nr:ELOB [Lepeophtheirus salmonis]CAF2983385.1 ELOB [Lepeophtheirus salmonis]
MAASFRKALSRFEYSSLLHPLPLARTAKLRKSECHIASTPSRLNGEVIIDLRKEEGDYLAYAKETTSVLELKKMIEGITKRSPGDQRLFNKDDQIMEDDKSLSDYGLNANVAKAQFPAEVGLAYKDSATNTYEDLKKTPYSSPPELPDAMKPGQEAATAETATA